MTATTPDPRPPLRERLLDRLDDVGDALHLPVTGRRVPGTIAVAVLAALASLAASAYFVRNHLSLAARTLSSRNPRFVTMTQVVVAVLTASALVAQTLWLVPAPDRRSLVLFEAVTQQAERLGPRRAAEWLGENYDGGRILIDEALPRNTVLPLAGLPLREYYLASSPGTFAAAIAYPVGHVRWVWATEDPNDRVGRAITADPSFQFNYRVAYSETGLRLYLRR